MSKQCSVRKRPFNYLYCTPYCCFDYLFRTPADLHTHYLICLYFVWTLYFGNEETKYKCHTFLLLSNDCLLKHMFQHFNKLNISFLFCFADACNKKPVITRIESVLVFGFASHVNFLYVPENGSFWNLYWNIGYFYCLAYLNLQTEFMSFWTVCLCTEDKPNFEENNKHITGCTRVETLQIWNYNKTHGTLQQQLCQQL